MTLDIETTGLDYMHDDIIEVAIPPERVLAAYASDNEREILVNDLTGITIKERRVRD